MNANGNGHLPIHELADLFPPMTVEEYDQLKADIEVNGVHQAVAVWRGAVIDGRHRYTACEELGLAPPLRYLPDEADPVAFVRSANLARRSLNPSQKALMDAKLTSAARKYGQNLIENLPQKTRGQLAGVGHAIINSADQVLAYGDKDIIRAIDRGDITLSDAHGAMRTALRARRAAERAEQEAERAEAKAREMRQDAARKRAEAEAQMKRNEETQASLITEVEQSKIDQALPRVLNGEARTLTAAKNLVERELIRSDQPPLPDGRYRTVVVDPPWPMQKIARDVRPNQAGFDYPTMTLEQIKAFPLEDMIADDCLVFLWSTQRFLPDAFGVLDAWGLRYRFCMTWHKPGGFQPLNSPQFNSEFVLVGSKGTPRFTDTKAFSTTFEAPRGGHSEKPQHFYELLNRVTPGPRLDVFNRREIEGFDGWGNEAGSGQG